MEPAFDPALFSLEALPQQMALLPPAWLHQAHPPLPSILPPTETATSLARSLELFIDLCLFAFLFLATYTSHRMIVEKMEAKKAGMATGEAAAVAAAKKDDDAGGAGAKATASPAKEASPARVVKAAASTERTRSRRKMA